VAANTKHGGEIAMAQRDDNAPEGGRLSRTRAFIARLHPSQLAPIPVCVLFVLARQFGVIANEPLWVLIGVVAIGWAVSSLICKVFPEPNTLQVAVEMACIVLVTYTIGWGALLAIGFVFNAAGHFDDMGSRVGRPAILFSIIGIAAGEIAIMLGIAKSLFPEPQGHGLAVLECVGVCFVIWMLAYTQRQKEIVETDLRRSEERLRALVQHASDVILVLQADGQVSYTSPALMRLLGYEQLDRIGREVLPDDQIERASKFFTELMQKPGDVAWIELPLRHVDGTIRWFEVGVTNRLDDPAVSGLVCNLRDVSERRAAQEQLEFQAYHDALTCLPNRWQFLERLEQALFDASTNGRDVAVLFLDVDRFKLVNDTLGHDTGDRLLVKVAERLASCLRPTDVVARFGGDEFSILIPNLSDPNVAIRVAERIVESLRDPVMAGEHELHVSTSIGIAISQGGQVLAGDLLSQSDLAMYVAKDNGRARWELFDPHTAPHMMERLELESDLWRAIDGGELVVQFQPEMDLFDGQVVATEALIRWQHPTRGLISPDRFIPFAEESGLIVAIDRLVLREACKWAHQWSHLTDAGGDGQPIVVSVNLSPRSLGQEDVVYDIMKALDETGVDPRCIQIELTERSALTDLEVTSSKLRRLRSLGVRVAIDDFGTGYSSLSYLKQLPIDVLKLDKSLLDSIDTVASDVAIVQAAITMGHALGMKITAEGVERVEQADRLRELGCDTACGWLWSPAVSPEKLREYAVSAYAAAGIVRTVEVLSAATGG
jgi:diguanylate cyclase (GGDEF)-like protein/PAS domain S-box-containing protein